MRRGRGGMRGVARGCAGMRRDARGSRRFLCDLSESAATAALSRRLSQDAAGISEQAASSYLPVPMAPAGKMSWRAIQAKDSSNTSRV